MTGEAIVRELEGKGVRTAAFKADQADRAQVEGLVKAVVARFGRLDILVNNAGVFVPGAVDSPENNIAEFDRQHSINVGGVVAAVRAATRVMSEGGAYGTQRNRDETNEEDRPCSTRQYEA